MRAHARRGSSVMPFDMSFTNFMKARDNAQQSNVASDNEQDKTDIAVKAPPAPAPTPATPASITQPVTTPATVEPSNKSPLEKLIENLQEDLRLEYQAVVHYARYAETVKGIQYQPLMADFRLHANDELKHASELSKQLAWMGAAPTMDVKPCRVVESAAAVVAMLLADENDAVQRYTERIKQAEALNMYPLAHVLREIAEDEQHHAIDLEAYIEHANKPDEKQ